MKKGLFVRTVLILMVAITCSACLKNSKTVEEPIIKTEVQKVQGEIVSNELFSITLPEKVKGTYTAETENGNIYIYDTVSKNNGFGGFAFGIEAYKNPADHANMPSGKKLGELVDKNNVIYDIVLVRPTDVQFDYKAHNDKTYKILYELAENIDNSISGVNGNKYYDKQGTKGEELYKDVLKKYKTAIGENWNAEKLTAEDISIKFNKDVNSTKDFSNEFGYQYYDLNGDGIEELLIGEIAQRNNKSAIYDIYTMINRKPAHAVRANLNENYYACDESFICKEYFMRGNEDGIIVYLLSENSTELFLQAGFKYSKYENSKKPWFISYDTKLKEWENVDEKTYKKRKAVFDKYGKFNFIPFNEIKF